MSNASVNTVYAGESGPNNENGLKTGVTAILIFTAIALPIASFSAWMTWMTFSFLKIKRSVILAALALYIIILLLISPWINVFSLFINGWTQKIPEIIDGKESEIISGILQIFIMQAPLSIIVGVLVGLIYSSWFWKFRRASWEEVEFKKTPWEWYRLRKNIKDIKEDKNTPFNGVTLGVSKETGDKIIQSDEEGTAHTLYIGSSGTGKSTTILMTARDTIKRGNPLIFVDVKGDPKLAQKLKEFADRYGRTFRHWSMQSVHETYSGPSELGPAYYDPIARGEASRRTNLLMAIKKWSEPYYESLAREYLQKAFLIHVANPDLTVSTLEDIYHLLDPKNLLKRSEKLAHDPAYRQIVTEIENMNDEKISREELSALGSLKVDLKNLTHNVIGPWLKKDPKKLNDINLFEAAHNGEVILFTLDSSNYEKESSVMGNLIIQDVKTLTSDLRKTPTDYPVRLIIDEFSAIGTDNITGLISKARDAKVAVSLTTQSLGDLKKADPSLTEQLLGIIGAFCIHRTNLESDAEIYAGLTGRIIRKRFRQSVEHTKNFFGIGKGAGAGSGFLEDVEEYVVPVPELQELKTGEMWYLSKITQRLVKVSVIPESPNLTSGDRTYKPIIIKTPTPYEPENYVTFPTTDEEENFEIINPKNNSEEEDTIITVKHSDVNRLEKIFNRPAKDFTNDTAPEYSKHRLPPKKVTHRPTEEKNLPPQNLTPPVFKLPARDSTLKPKTPTPGEQKTNQETPPQENKKDTKISTPLPEGKDEFDF